MRRVLGVAFGTLLLAWTAQAGAQTSPPPPQSTAAPPPESQLRVTEPEPKESLLTPSKPTPEGDVPLLRRFIPGLAEGMAQLLRYAEGSDAENPSTNSGLPRVREGNVDVTWNIPWVRGLQFRFRNAYVAESGERC